MSDEWEDLIECEECFWQGDASELVCAEDAGVDGPFNICPDCGVTGRFDNVDTTEATK